MAIYILWGRQHGTKCADTQSLFEEILKELGLFTVMVVAHPPYATLVDTEWWHADEAKAEYIM